MGSMGFCDALPTCLLFVRRYLQQSVPLDATSADGVAADCSTYVGLTPVHRLLKCCTQWWCKEGLRYFFVETIQPTDRHTHPTDRPTDADRQTDGATTIPESQNWPRVKMAYWYETHTITKRQNRWVFVFVFLNWWIFLLHLTSIQCFSITHLCCWAIRGQCKVNSQDSVHNRAFVVMRLLWYSWKETRAWIRNLMKKTISICRQIGVLNGRVDIFIFAACRFFNFKPCMDCLTHR